MPRSPPALFRVLASNPESQPQWRRTEDSRRWPRFACAAKRATPLHQNDEQSRAGLPSVRDHLPPVRRTTRKCEDGADPEWGAPVGVSCYRISYVDCRINSAGALCRELAVGALCREAQHFLVNWRSPFVGARLHGCPGTADSTQRNWYIGNEQWLIIALPLNNKFVCVPKE